MPQDHQRHAPEKQQAQPAQGHCCHHHGGGKPVEGPADAIYTCPMHPEVRQIGPGSCPKCGMALEPVAPTSATGPDPELIDFTRRFWLGLALALPVFVMDMGSHFFDLDLSGLVADHRTLLWAQAALATPVALWSGWPLLARGWRSFRSFNLNMFSLIGLGVVVAYGYSLVALLAPHLFPPAFRNPDGSVDVYFEAAAVITVLVLLGQVMELRARAKTGKAISALMDLSPKIAFRVTDAGGEEEVSLADIGAGDRLRVKPGAQVPLDGVLLSGGSEIDESMLTGEPMPVRKGEGDNVIGGTLNRSGSFVMKVTETGADTLLARIIALVAEAQRSRAPIQRLADVVAGYFVPIVIGVAVLAFLGWSIWGPSPAMAYGLVAGVSVLIIACPCALGLATPMSITVGVGRAASAGILIKNAQALEQLEKIDMLVVDKTGTLTEGRPRLIEVHDKADKPHDLLKLAASLERESEHPLAQALVAGAEDKGLSLAASEGFEAITGQGIKGRVEGHDLLLGNDKLMPEIPSDLHEAADAARQEGHIALFMAVDGQVRGYFVVGDPVKENAADAVKGLHAHGVKILMLTGDHALTAKAVARKLGIDDVRANVSPEDKAQVVKDLRGEGYKVAMVGDGINDAPALASADVGIAMGTGTDVAIESAGVTLLKGDLSGILRARKLSEQVMRNIRQNLVFAFAYNALGVPIAAGALYPAFGLLLSPMIAAAAMSLSSVSVISNALRLRASKL